jgi:hydrogenase maturation protease
MQHRGDPATGVDGERILILGIGNLLWADEGFGVRCAEALAAEWRLPERVTVLDGGTQGLYLLPFLEEADALIVFDAVDYGLPPGTMKIARDDEAPAFLGAKKMSLHQTGFQEVIATAMLLGRCPERLLLIGVQPVELEDYGGVLRPEIAARIPEAIAIALTELRDAHGITPGRRDAPAPDMSPLGRKSYEGERPSADAACRHGDPRFLAGA